MITDGDAEMEMAVTDLAERSAADIPPRYSVPRAWRFPPPLDFEIGVPNRSRAGE